MRKVQRCLIAAMQDAGTLPHLEPDDWLALPALARDHGLSTRLDALLTDRNPPAAFREAIRADTRTALASQLQVEADLARLAPLLGRTAVPWAVVKGPVLADHWYREKGQRSFTDLDVLVDPSSFALVLEALTAAGVELLDRNWTLALRQQRAEISLVLRHGTVLDLHWHLLNTPELRREMPLSTASMLARSRTVALGRLRVPTLDPEDTLLHLCLHTTLSGGQQLSWYRDIQQVLAHGQVDWNTFVARVEEAQAGLPAALALRRARQLADASVPVGLEKKLAPRGRAWRTFVRSIDTLRPLGHPTDSTFSGRLAVLSSRDDTRGSVRALRRSLAEDLVAPFLRDARHPWRKRDRHPPAEHTNPLWGAPEDEADRQRYLSFVAAQRWASPSLQAGAVPAASDSPLGSTER